VALVSTDPSVTLQIPAQSAYVALIRAAVSAMCARLDFTIDRIDDVKLAVDEAAALLLGDAPPNVNLSVAFTPEAPDGLVVRMSAPTIHGRSLERDSFTWTVLTALVDDVVATVGADRTMTITLGVHRGQAVRP
jgi:serine/threonine-protein kinase RsbW